MEQVRCGLCGEEDATPLVQNWDRSHGQPGVFDYVTCRACGLIYLTPRPDETEIAAFYPDDYVAHRYGPIDDERNPFVRWNRRYGMSKRCRVVTRRLTGGRLLDVGCGSGVFLDEMRRQGGWEVEGEDVSEAAVAFARDRFRLNVFHGTLEAASYPDGWFDAVTLWNVIEHVPDPVGLLREVARITRSGGIVVVETPNYRSVDARLFGPYWCMWEAPRHFQIFTPATMARALSAAEFGQPNVRCVIGSWFSLITSAQYVAEAAIGWRPTSGARTRWNHQLALVPLRLATLPYLWLVDRLGLGSTMVVTASRN